jgi:hypothetical protein
MDIQLEIIHGTLVLLLVCQVIQVIGQWFTHSALLEMHKELSRIASILERMEK